MFTSKNKTLSIIFLSLYTVALLAVPIFVRAATFDIPCKPTEYSANQAPTTGTVNNTDLFDCVNQLYKYALIISSIAAVFMIIIAGYMYIFSGGNTGKVSTAKNFITTSLLGITVLLAGFLLLKQINPNLLVLKNLTPQQIGQTHWAAYGNGGYANPTKDTTPRSTGPAGGGKPGAVAGNGVTCNGGEDQHPDRHVNCGCFANEVKAAADATGVSPALIRAVLFQESNCGSTAVSSAGAYGVMQVLERTANGNNCPANWKTDTAANILCGALALKRFSLAYSKDGPGYILAAYNGGDVGQQASGDCPGMRKFECPFDNAAHTACNTGYLETRKYFVTASRFYNEAQACRN